MIKKVIFLIFIFIAVFSFLLCTENTGEEKIAALEKKLEKAPGEEKVKILIEISNQYRATSAAESIRRGQQALQLAQTLDYPEGKAAAYNNIAIGSCILGDMDKGIDSFQKALGIYKKIDDRKGISKVTNNIGIVYRRSGNLDKAIECFKESLQTELQLQRKVQTANAYLNLGNAYSDKTLYNIALDYYMRALKISEELEDNVCTADVLENIGNVYLELNKSELALQYLGKALKIVQEKGNKYAICSNYISTGLVYQDLKNYSKALEYFQNAAPMAEELGDRRSLCYALGSIGSIYMDLKDYHKALEYYERAYEIEKEIDDNRHMGLTFIGLGNTYLNLQKYEKARAYLELGLKQGKELKVKGLEKGSYEGLSKLYATLGNYKKALDYYQLFHQTDQEILDEKSSQQINELQTRYESEKKANEIAVLKKNNEIQDLRLSKARFTRNAFIIGFLMVVVILGLLFKKYLYLFSFWKKQKYIGQYRLMDKLGSGAMGTIFKAHSVVDKSKIAAVKILRDELFDDEVNKKRFHREAAIIDKLEHPNIIKIYERGESKQALFLAMEFLAGKTLEKKIGEEGQLPMEESLHILLQISGALAYIHGMNIIHRDLKPANIMLIEKDGDPNFVKLLDFGLAKMELASQLTHSGNFLGTLQYVAPEQVLNADSSPANDIFSLAVMVYRMLCGQSPFSGDSPIEIMRKIIMEEPRELSQCRDGIPQELNLLVIKMMNKEPEQRPTAQEIHECLNTLISS